MEIDLHRFMDNGDTTIGMLYIDGNEFCFSLEDEGRVEKVAGETRIPAGRYKIGLRKEGGMHERYTKKLGKNHKGMIQILDIPSFTYVYIHIGNTEEHTAGCPLIGFSASLRPLRKWRVLESTDAYVMFATMVYGSLDDGEEVNITIHDDEFE
jgi:hypothetical protein